MQSIIEMRQELTDVQNQLRTETQRGYDLAHNPQTEMEELRTAQSSIERLQVREALIQQNIARQEGRDNAPGAMTKQPAHSAFSSAGEFFSAVREAGTPGRAFDRRLSSPQNTATGANEGVGAEGGFLVPPEYSDGILDFMKTKSVLYPQARKVTIAGSSLIDTYLDEKARKDGQRHAGILSYWKGEGDQFSAVKAAFAQRKTDANKLTAYAVVTEELLEDAPAIESVLGEQVGKEFAFKLDDVMLHGTGEGQPLGILAAGNKALVTVDKESAQAAGTLLQENVLNMYNALIAGCRANANYYINQDLELPLMRAMMSFKPTEGAMALPDGVPLYTPPGAFGSEYATVLGKKVIPIEQCEATGKAGDIVFADMSQYLIVERRGLTKSSSIHVRFDYDETVFKFSLRLGGRPDWMNAVEAYKGATKRSPYVVLAARA